MGTLQIPGRRFRSIDRAALAARQELTARERDILGCIARGMTLKESAAYLGIAPKTADRHRTRLLRSIGVRNSVEATLWAVDRGIIRPRWIRR